MWLAYVLLCRDIELACDEKVIKVLGNEQRADYTQALVACSVNRRVIAACPLAFGEVGVKERVKSVMNYKNPAFWIVVLAVIACVVVAVCFLTDPEQDSYTLRIVVPAGSQDDFVYSDEEVSTTGNSIVIWSGEGLDDTEVLLFPVDETTETGYTATYLTHGMPVEFDAVKDEWFKVGINMQTQRTKTSLFMWKSKMWKFVFLTKVRPIILLSKRKSLKSTRDIFWLHQRQAGHSIALTKLKFL